MSRTPQRPRVPVRVIVQALVGLVAVVASLAGVVLVLDSNGQTQTIALAPADLAAGFFADDIAVQYREIPVDAGLGPSFGSDEFQALSGMVTNRALREGDILQTQDFSLPQNSDLTALAIDVTIGQPSWLVAGQRVVLWVAPPASENSFSAPFVLSGNVVIESVMRDEGFAADGSRSQVNIVVSPQDVPGVVHALANRYFLYLVPEP